MYIYIVLCILLFMGYRILPHSGSNKSKNYQFAVFAVVSFTLLIGLRAESVGSDTEQYAERYRLTLERIAYGWENTEMGFDYIQYFFKEILGFGYNGFLFFIALFSMCTLGYMIHRFSLDELTSYILFIMLLLSMYMSGIRQITACSLCLWALIMLEKGKYKYIKFLALVGCAYLIHNSALIFLPVLLLRKVRITRAQGGIIFLVSVLSILFLVSFTPIIQYLAPIRYEEFALNLDYKINPLVIIVQASMVAFALLFLPTTRNEKGKFVFDHNDSLFLIFACIQVFFVILSISNNQLGRLGFYYSIGFLVSVPNALVKTNGVSSESKETIQLIIQVLCLAYFFMSLNGNVMQIDEYKFFWER